TMAFRRRRGVLCIETGKACYGVRTRGVRHKRCVNTVDAQSRQKLTSSTMRNASPYDRDHAERTSGTVHDLERRGNDHGAGGAKLVEIAKAGESELAAAVHHIMIRKRRIEAGRLAGIGAHGLHADSEHIAAAGQQVGTLFGKTRCVRAVRM